jgi:pilus assembly protein Flp/PilA
MSNFKQIVNNLINDESGQDLIEYALVAALVGLGAVVSLQNVRTAIQGAFSSIASSLNTSV